MKMKKDAVSANKANSAKSAATFEPETANVSDGSDTDGLKTKSAENVLSTMTEKWMKLERKTLKQREAAELFYEKNLLKLIENDFVLRNKDKISEEVEYLVLSVGTSCEPLILDICLLKPEKILFLCTKKTEKYLTKIVKYCELQAEHYQKTIVSETDPSDIYMEIKRAYLTWGQPQKLYIDFTGGTKAMSAAAAMAGAMINVQLLYVGSNEYLSDFRKPKPGSETLFYITNPLEVFGDLEIEKAFILFSKYNYSGAREKLTELKENIPDPNIRQQLNFVYLLANVYEMWDVLDFEKAYLYITKLNKELLRDKRMHSQFLMMDMIEVLNEQEQILEPLSKIPQLMKEKKPMEILTSRRYMIPLMFTMLQNAAIREEQEKYDMATLLLYRLLEMIDQCRLSKYNLYVSKMDYMQIKADGKKHPEWTKLGSKELFDVIKERYSDVKTKVFGKMNNAFMAEQISLLDGFFILAALDDEISKLKNGNQVEKLKRIRAMVYLRNNSIFAHGLGPVGKEDFEKFRTFVIDLFKEFCILEGVDYAKYRKKIAWINPFQSMYYVGLEA